MVRSANQQPVQVDIVAPAIVSSEARDKNCVVVSSQDVVVIRSTTDGVANRKEDGSMAKSIRLSPKFLFTATVALMSCLFFVASSLLILSFPILGYTGQASNLQSLYGEKNVSSVQTPPTTGARVVRLANKNDAIQKLVQFRNYEAPVQRYQTFETSSQIPRRDVTETHIFRHMELQGNGGGNNDVHFKLNFNPDPNNLEDNLEQAVFVKANSFQSNVFVQGR